MARLPESQRDAIELFHLQGLSLREIAKQLGRSESAVAGLLHRGLRQLREEIRQPAVAERARETERALASLDRAAGPVV